MPLPEQNILEQSDILAGQRNPGFETEGLPSPAGFDSPDIPSVAPIPIPGTGLSEGNDAGAAYLARFNKSILGAKEDITPGNLPTYTANDVYNPRYKSILPGEDSEEAFAKGQGWAKQWGNALVKTAATTVGTFVGGLMSIPNTIAGNPYDTSMGNSIDTWLKNMEDTFPNYYTKWQQDHPFMSALPGSGGFSNFWGDKFIKNLGFTVGAIGSAVAQDAVVGFATEGLGEIPLVASQIGKASLWLNKVFTGTNRAEELLQLGRAAGRTGEQLVDLKNLATAAAATKITDGARYAINLYGAAAAEAGIEARDGYNTIRKDLITAYINERGYSPTGKDLDDIEKHARAGGNIRFGANLALLMISDAIQFDKFLKPFSAAKSGFKSAIEKSISEKSSIGLAEGSIDEFQRLPKNLWGKIRPIVPSILTEGVFEEGGQFATQIATENFYERKYLYDKGLSTKAYSKDETPYDPRDHVKNIVHSIVQGLHDEFTTDEGLENVVLGALTGAVFGGVKMFMDRNTDKQLVVTTLNLLNSQGVTGVMQNHYDSAATAHRIAEDMQEAVKSNDVFKYKNFQHEQFVNFITSGAKAGRFDVRLEQLKMLKDMDNDAFKAAFGLDKTTDSVKTVTEYTDALIQKANQIKRTYDLINNTFTNPFSQPKATTPEAAEENRKHQIFETWKDQLTFLASIAADVEGRLGSMREDIREVVPTMDHNHVSNFTNKKYLKAYGEDLNKEVKSLKDSLDAKVSADPTTDRARIKLLESKIGAIDSMVASKNITDSKFGNLFRDVLQFHMNGQTDTNDIVIPQEAVPMLIDYGMDINRLKDYREQAYYAFDKLSTPEGFEKYFREAQNIEDQYAQKPPPTPPPGSAQPPASPTAPTPPGTPPAPKAAPKEVVTVKDKERSKSFEVGKDAYVTRNGKQELVTIKGVNQQNGNVIAQTKDGEEIEVKDEDFFQPVDKAVEQGINENTSVEDVPPATPGQAGTKEGPQKKDLSFSLFSTTDPVYSRQDVPFTNFHRRHQNFLFDMGSTDPDVFNQDNKPKLRIIPVTAKTAQALGFPLGFFTDSGNDVDNSVIRAVYVVDDTVDPVKRSRQRNTILSMIAKSKTLADHTKANAKTHPDQIIQELYEQARDAAGAEEQIGEKLVDKLLEYGGQGLFFVDGAGEKLGKVGSPVDPDVAIFTTFASTDLNFQASPGQTEERYTNKDNIDPQAAVEWWRQVRADILSGTTAADAMQKTYQFAVSRGIPHVIKNGTRNNPIAADLIRERDLDKTVITIPTVGDVAVMGAFNEEGEGIPASKSGVSMPLGTPLLNHGGSLTFLNARTFTPAEASNIYEMLRIISDRNRTVDSGPLFKYLHKVIYMANPEKNIAPTPSSITITKEGELYLGTSPVAIPLVPEAIEANRDRILDFLAQAHHNVKNSELLRIQRDPKANDLEFTELRAANGTVEVANRWKNYNYYLISNRTPEGNARADSPLTVNVAIPQVGERPIIQKYAEILSFDFDPSKFKRAEVAQPVDNSIQSAKDAIAKVIADAKNSPGGLTVDTLEELKSTYAQDDSFSDAQKAKLLGAIDLLQDRIKQKDQQQGVQKAPEQPQAQEESQTAPTTDVLTIPFQGRNLGFRVLSRDAQGNVDDIEAVGTVADDGSITPYKDAAVVKEMILKILRASQIKEDDTNTDKTQSTKDKFKGRDFKRGTDRFRRAYPANNDYIKANLEEEFTEVREILPDWFSFKVLDQMLRTTEGGLAWGALEDSFIKIYKDAEVGTTYHEAFEAVWYHFVDGKEQQDIYDEFVGRKGKFTTYEGKEKSYSDATVKEAKEQLAEEFRDYKITGKIPTEPKQRNFFQRLIKFIKWLLGLESSDRNRLFKKMNKGYYRNYASSLRGPMGQPEYSYYREPGLSQFSETTVQDMLQGMTAELLGEIFGENTAIIDSLEEDFKATAATIYSRLKDKFEFYFEDEVEDTGTLFAEIGADVNNAANEDDVNALIQQMDSIRTIWGRVKDNWGSFVKEHERYLRIFNVEFVVDDEGEISMQEAADEIDSENKSPSDYIRDMMTMDAKSSASIRIKLLIASIADSEWVREATRAGMTAADSVRSKRESSSLRLPKLVQYAKLFNYLLHNTAGINGIYDIWGKLTEMTEDVVSRKLIDANVRKFMSRLKFDGGFENKTPADARLILSAENTMTKQKPAFFRQFTDFQRNTYFKTTVLNSKIDQVKSTWVASIKGSKAIIPSAENRFLFSRAVIGASNPVDFLNRIGIDITQADFRRLRGANISKFNDAVNTIRALVERAARDRIAIPIVSSKQLDFDSRLNSLAELYVTHMVGEDTQSQHPNLDNEQTSNFVLNNLVSTIVNDANHSSDRDDFVSRQDNEYFNDIFHQDSILLNKIIFDAKGKKNKEVQIGVVEGRETWDRNNRSTSSLTEAERLLYEINNNLNGVFYTLLPADAKTEWAIYIGKDAYLSADGFFGDEQTRYAETRKFADQMYSWLQTEVALARDFENRKFIDSLNRTPKGEDRAVGKSLRFFKDILPKSIVDDIHSRVIDQVTPLGEVLSQDQMYPLMREYALTSAEATFQELLDWKILHASGEKFVMYGFDKTFVTNTLGKDYSHDAAKIQRLLMFREMNYIMNNIEMHKFFFGDPAQYKDELKRIKSFLSGREYTHVDMLNTSEGFNQWADANLNKAGEALLTPQDPGYQFFKNHYNTLTALDITFESNMIEEIEKAIGEKAAKPYTEGNEDDAGAYMAAPAYRETLWKSGGRWTNAQEKQFQWEMAWERNDKAAEGKYTYSSEALRKHDEELLKQEPDTEVAFPILKLMHSGIQTQENVAIASLDKASWAPLFYRWYKGKGLGELYNAMQKRGIDYVRMESAHKVGIQKESTFTMYNAEGAIDSTAIEGLSPEMIPMKQIGIQVEQAKKEKGQTEGSQLRKIAIGDLRENGVPIDFQKGYPNNQAAYNAWNNLETEEQKIAASPIYAKIKRHNDALINLTTNRTILAMRRMGMEVSEENGTVTIPDKKMISDFILSELERRELPRNIASAVQISPETRDFSNPIEANPQYTKIRAIVYSILEKTVTRPKVNGGQKTMLSVSGMESGPRVVKRMVNGKPVYTSDVLKFYKQNDTGTEACEVMLPYWFGKKLMEAGSGRTKEEVIKYLNSTEEGRKLLMGIGFRIPTQGLNSVDFFVVKDFLPEQMGDVVVLPSEITVKAGSDFDIDKLNVYLRNFYVDAKTGFPELMTFRGSEQATKEHILNLIQNGNISANSVKKEMDEFLAEQMDELSEETLYDDLSIREYREQLIQDFLEGRENNKVDMFYQKTLENEYFDSIQDLLALPENYSRLITPNDASELKGYRDKMLALKGESTTPLGNYGKLLSSTFMMKERQAYMSSKQVVGISAVSQTAQAISQNLQGGLLVLDRSYVARFPANIINGMISLSSLKVHGKDKLISNINSQTTDGGVDVAKDKFLAEMGINKDTLSTFLTLVRMGADPWWAITYLNQPAIQEFLKEKAISKSVSQINPFVKDKSDIALLNETFKKFGDVGKGNKNIKNKPNHYSIKEMEEMISAYARNPESLTAEQKKLQMMMLDDFSNYDRSEGKYKGYSGLAWDLFHFYQGYNWDTARMNDPNLVRLKALKYEKANNLAISQASKVMEDTFIGPMMQSILQLDEGLRSVINVQHGAAGSVLDDIARDVFKMAGGEAVKQQLLLTAELSMVDYSVQTNAQVEGRVVNSMLAPLLLSNTATAFYIDALRRHSDKRLSENPFVKALTPILDRRPGYPSAIVMNERDYDTYTSNVLTDAFRELREDATVISISDNPNEDKTVAQIYRRLVLTAMVQSGARSGRGQFAHLIPSETYSEIVRDSLRNMRLDGFYENLALYRGNWTNTGLVPFATKELTQEEEEAAYAAGDFNPEPYFRFFVNPRVSQALNKAMVLTTGHPIMLEQPANKYRRHRVIKMEELTRDRATGQIIERRIRLFRRVDVLGENGMVPLTYDRNRVLYTEINAWGDNGIREFYNTQNQSVLPTNNQIPVEANDDQILYALASAGIQTNAAEDSIIRAFNEYDRGDEDGESDESGNEPPISPDDLPLLQIDSFEEFKNQLTKKCN